MGSLQQQSMATSVYRSAVAIAFTGDELGGNVAGRDALMGATSQAFRNAKKKKKKKRHWLLAQQYLMGLSWVIVKLVKESVRPSKIILEVSVFRGHLRDS